jgi:cytochrome c peroxidase
MTKHNASASARACITISLLAIPVSAAPARTAANANPGHLGLPALSIPAANPLTPAKIALGEKLFFDPRLSRDGATSCASCHRPAQAFSDGNAVARGANGQHGLRNTPSLLNAALQTSLFWDGRRASLESQALDPLLNMREHGLPDAQAILRLISENKTYAAAFLRAFPASTTIDTTQVAQALASYQRTLLAGNSSFDRYYYQHEQQALSPAAIRGLALFRGRAGCASCHTIGEQSALFSDQEFHSLGNKLQGKRLAALSLSWMRTKTLQISYDQATLSEPEIAELGRFLATGEPRDLGAFRTPSLRNVARTAPYMHDGSVATLEDAIELEMYYRSSRPGQPPLVLTAQEKADLVSFLQALNSPAQDVVSR